MSNINDLPRPEILEMKFQKVKRYRRIKIENYSDGKFRVLADVNSTNTLLIKVFPSSVEPYQLEGTK